MSTIRCKMCDANMEVMMGETVAKCSYCGTEQTLPVFYDNKKEVLYHRAEHLRKADEFDGARKIYEELLVEDLNNAELYWMIVLCEFGIEYVEDIKTGLQIPTINRMQYQSILTNANYLSAIRLADDGQKRIYEHQATQIEHIQKGIMDIANKEEPYDVFICYKESDEKSRRTKDSVYANDIYHELTEEGYRVFYAKISLEDKVGQDYEPYIFSALNSAKVMIVLGTKPEYFQATWVKNEWSRFLTLMEKGEKKQLVPAYKKMGAEELPKEFHTFLSLDMDEIGFMQDLIRGIKKIVGEKEEKESQIQVNQFSMDEFSVEQLIQKAKFALERGLFEYANDFCEDILNQDAHNGAGYFYKFLALGKYHTIEEVFQSIPDRMEQCDKRRVDLTSVYEEKVRNAVEKLVIPSYCDEFSIRKCFEYIDKSRFVLELPDWDHSSPYLLTEKEEKLLAKAEEYGGEAINKEIADIKERMLEILQQKKAEEGEMIQQKQIEIVSDFDICYEKAENEHLKAKRQMDADYEKAVKILSDKGKTRGQLIVARGIFRDLGSYKDSVNKLEWTEFFIEHHSNAYKNIDLGNVVFAIILVLFMTILAFFIYVV